MPRSDDRFARQNRGALPPEFPLASPCPGIDHHLSGPNVYARTPCRRRSGVHGSALRTRKNSPRSRPLRSGHTLLSLSLRRGVAWLPGPTTRVQVRLLGPCFKTGREGSRSTSPPTRGRETAGSHKPATRSVPLRRRPEHEVPEAWRRRGDATGPPSNACVRSTLTSRTDRVEGPLTRKFRGRVGKCG